MVELRIYVFSDINQEKIVEEGGLDALLMLLQASEHPTILRVASGAIANLAMNGNLACPSNYVITGKYSNTDSQLLESVVCISCGMDLKCCEFSRRSSPVLLQ